MTDDVKIGRARFDAYQQASPQVESVGDAPDLRYITGAELDRLRTRLQRAEELLRKWSQAPCDYMLLTKETNAFLGERHD